MTTTTDTLTAATPKAAPHPLRAEAVRGFPPLAGIAVMVAVGVMMIATARTWQGDWAETAGRMHDGLLMAVPVAAAAGCWHGGRERRRRTEELWGTAVRPPLTRLLASAVPVALWVAVGYLLVVACASLATWPYSPGDHPHLILVPGDTAALMAAVLLGHVVGRIVPSLLAAPLLGVAGYAGLAGVVPHDGVQPLDPASFTLNGSWPVWWQPLAMAAWTLGLALAVALAYAARRRATALLPLAAALTGAALLVQGGDATWQADPLLRRQVCDTSTTPAICVNARYGAVLPQVTTALSGITGRLRGVEGLPVRWADRENGPRSGEAQLPILTPVGWALVRGRLVRPDQYAYEAVAALMNRGECERQSERVAFADDAVMSYLAPNPAYREFDAIEARGDAAERAHLRASLAARAKLAGMDEERRRVWLSAYFTARAACDDAGVPSL
ncbi:hypothetical protein ACIPPM_11125 [Streptomyces sp. NPDC090119]|uniref:hypothetical protein n=1 Tax=Streptomyces sp. NPDC090119 TaxID=3365951 RepID=UPI0037FD16F5